MSSTTPNFGLIKPSRADNVLVQNINDNSDILDTVIKKAIENIAPTFDSTASYTMGQHVTYESQVYRFTADHSGGWTGTDVVATSLANGVGGMVSDGGTGLVITI